MRKTILIFIWYFLPPGGAETFTEEIVKRLSLVFDFQVITARCERRLSKREQIPGALVHRVGTGYFLIDKFLFPLFGFFKAWQLRRKKKVVLAHGVIANFAGLTAMLFARVFGLPFFLTEQSGNLDARMWKLGGLAFWLYKKTYQKADFVQVISNALKQKALALGVDEKKIEVIPNGINIGLIRQICQNSGIKKQKHRVLCVARLEKYKGVEYLVKAMPQVVGRFSEAELAIVGDGPERKNLEELTAKLGIENKVKFLGELPYEKTIEEFAKSEVFVGPSLEEGMGIVFVEARATGLVIVGTKVGGIPDVIENGVNGILVEPANSSQLAAAIIKIFSEPELARRLAENAKKGLEKYDWQNVAECLLEIYKRLF